MAKRKHVKSVEIKDLSGYSPAPGRIVFAKKHHYTVVTNIAITGDAPKDFIRYYHYGTGRKGNEKSWPLFIAKLGHKHYPIESITEYLLNRVGEEFGFNMAASELAWLGGQIRFLSRYFLKNQQEYVLEHGADLYAGYLNDREFVEEIEVKRQAADFFTVQFTQETLKHFFPEDYDTLMLEFIKLLVYDALVGNNDRHFYNWGIISKIQGHTEPLFSPIYDTARGLFWNDHEDKIIRIYRNKRDLNTFIQKYSESSMPKIGWDDKHNLNHFELLRNVISMPIVESCGMFQDICSDDTLHRVISMIDNDFSKLLSTERKALIIACLRFRHEKVKNILTLQHD